MPRSPGTPMRALAGPPAGTVRLMAAGIACKQSMLNPNVYLPFPTSANTLKGRHYGMFNR